MEAILLHCVCHARLYVAIIATPQSVAAVKHATMHVLLPLDDLEE
jgi:hypothetical protein